jgi:hypothetical protein
VYAARFGIDPAKRFALEFEVLEAAGPPANGSPSWVSRFATPTASTWGE